MSNRANFKRICSTHRFRPNRATLKQICTTHRFRLIGQKGLNLYIEWQQDDPDVMTLGYDITGMSVREVIAETNIDLADYFAKWHRCDRALPVSNMLCAPSETILNMRFDVLHELIRSNHRKDDYAMIFMAGIGEG